MMALYYPYYLGLFLFSLSHLWYAFLGPNDLPLQISGHLFNPNPDFIFRSIACSFLLELDCCSFISYLTRYLCIGISLLL
jgi:hypothetical protein